MKNTRRRADPDLENVKRAIGADWEITGGFPPEAERFHSMHTNSDEDRWWCRIDDKRLVVDVQATATTLAGCAGTTLPWVLRRDEKLWLDAKIARVPAER